MKFTACIEIYRWCELLITNDKEDTMKPMIILILLLMMYLIFKSID